MSDEAGRPDPGRPPSRRSGRTVRRAAVLVVKVLSAALSLMLLMVSAYAWSNYHDLDSGLRRIAVDVGPQSSTPAPAEGAPSTGLVPTPSASGSTSAPALQGQDQNLLVVGTDDRSDMTLAEIKKLKVGQDAGIRSDVIMIVHIPADGSKATLISIPRDSYVQIPGYSMNRINAAFTDGYSNSNGSQAARHAAGANVLIHTVENLTGLTIDHFIAVDFIGFYRIAQAIGGVPVTLCHSVDDTIRRNEAEGVQGGSGFKMSKGYHVLNPVQALEFVRQRHNLPGNSSDLERNARQRYFIAAAFRKIASAGVLLNPGRLHAIISAIKGSVYVDPGFDPLSLVRQLADLSANNIRGKGIPIVSDWPDSPAGDVLRVDPSQVKAFVHRVVSGHHASSGKHHRRKAAKPKPPDKGCVN